MCIFENCHNKASYGFITDFKKIYCNEHKNIEKDLINIRNRNKYCCNCYLIRGSYGYENDKKNLFCINCRLEDMIDVISKKCIKCNIKQPVFNYNNEKTPLYCVSCKLDNMVDIKSKKCIICNIKQPSCNYNGEKKHYIVETVN